MQMKKGQRDKLEKYIDNSKEFAVILYISGSAEYDYTCFGLDAKDKLSDDRYMIFYNQVSSPKNEISYSKINDGSMFNINLKSLPSFIKKLVFTVSIDGEGTMGEITTHKMVILQDKQPKINFQFDGKDFQSEKAIISFELYQKNEWRINVVGSGYNGGLADLLKEYGGEEAEEEQQMAQVKQASSSSFSPKKDTSGKPNQNEAEKPALDEEFRLGLKYSKYRLDKGGTPDDGKAMEHFKKAADKVKAKFWSEEENLYIIPFEGITLKYSEKICMAADIMEQFRWAIYAYMGSGIITAWEIAAKDYRSKEFAVFLSDVSQKILLKFVGRLVDIALNIFSKYGIFYVTKEDFISSQGGESSTLRNSQGKAREKHDSLFNIAMLGADDVVKKHSGDSDHLLTYRNGEVQVVFPRTTMEAFQYYLANITECIEKDVFFVLDITEYFDSVKRKTAHSIVDNIIKGVIPKEQHKRAFIQALQLDPFFQYQRYNFFYGTKEYKDAFDTKTEEFINLEIFLMMDDETWQASRKKISGKDFWEDIDDVMPRKSEEISLAQEYQIQDKQTSNQRITVSPQQQIHSRQNDWSDDWKNFCKTVLPKYNIPAVYFGGGGEKANQKIQAAWDGYGVNISQGEVTIACFDSTFFGAGDEGCLLTTRGIYLKTMLQDNVIFIPYRDIRENEFQVKGFIANNLYINGIEIDTSPMTEDKDKWAFANLIKDLKHCSMRQNQKNNLNPQRKFCKNCGKQISNPNVKFCTGCGSPL